MRTCLHLGNKLLNYFTALSASPEKVSRNTGHIHIMQMRYTVVMRAMRPTHYEAVMQATGRHGLISCCQIVEVVATDYYAIRIQLLCNPPPSS